MIPVTREPRSAEAPCGASELLPSARASSRSPTPRRRQGVSNEMRAEYLFREGTKKFDAGKHVEACADFAESLRLGPKLGTLLNLALCHEDHRQAGDRVERVPPRRGPGPRRTVRRTATTSRCSMRPPSRPSCLACSLTLPTDGAIATVDVDGEPLPDAHWYLPIFLDSRRALGDADAPGQAAQHGEVPRHPLADRADRERALPHGRGRGGAPLHRRPDRSSIPITRAVSRAT